MRLLAPLTFCFVFSGFLPVLFCTGRPILAATSAPVVSMLLAALAVLVSVTLSVALLPCWTVLLLIVLVAMVLAGPLVRPIFKGFEDRGALFALPALVFMGTTLRRPPRDWDTYAIWLLHAKRFAEGGDIARTVAQSPAYAFSHPDYPPGGSGLAAVVGRLAADFDGRGGYLGIVMLSLATCALLSMTIWIAARPSSAVAACILASMAPVFVMGYGHVFVIDGYLDSIWATLLVSALVLTCWVESTAASRAVALVMLAAAVVLKNDALPGCVALLILIAWRARRPVERLMCAVVVALPAWWMLLSRSLGVQSDVLDGEAVSRLALFDADQWARLGPTTRALWHYLWIPGLLLLVAAVLVGVQRSLGDQRGRVDAVTLSVLVFGVVTLALVGVYLVGPYDIAWWLATSIDRTSLVLQLGALLVAVLTALSVLDGVRRPGCRPPSSRFSTFTFRAPSDRGERDVNDSH